jgi:hypothetical protein
MQLNSQQLRLLVQQLQLRQLKMLQKDYLNLFEIKEN